MSSPFGAARLELARRLEAAGLTGVTIDPAAGVPFVLVDLITLTPPAQGIGAWPGTVPIRIVVPPPGNLEAAAALEAATFVVVATLGFAPATPTTYTTGAGQDCPAYELTYPVTVPNPDC